MNIQCINLRAFQVEASDSQGTQAQSLLSTPCLTAGISSGIVYLRGFVHFSASYDNLRLYDLVSDHKHGVPPFLIIPGHQSGTIASICTHHYVLSCIDLDVDPSCRFMLTAGGNRGWGGATTEVVMGYDVNVIT